MAVNGNRASIDISFEKKSPVLPAVVRSERPVVVVGENLKIVDVTSADALSPTGITNTTGDKTVELPDILNGQKVLNDDNLLVMLKFGDTVVVLEHDDSNLTINTDAAGFVANITIANAALAAFASSTVTVVSPIQVYIGAKYLDVSTALTVTAVRAETYENYTGVVTGDSNPLGFALSLVTNVQAVADTYFISLDNCDPVTGKGSYTDYTKALTKLAKDKKTYYIVPLTRDEKVITYMKGYLQNLAKHRKEKRAILAPEIPTKDQPTQVGSGNSIQQKAPATYLYFNSDAIVLPIRTIVAGTQFNGYHVTATIGTPSGGAKASVNLNTITSTFEITILNNALVSEVREALNSSGLIEVGLTRKGAESDAITDVGSTAIADLSGGSNDVVYITYVGSVIDEFVTDSTFGSETYVADVETLYYATVEGYPRKFYLAGTTTGGTYDGAGVDIDFNGIILAEDASAYGSPIVTEDEIIWKEATTTLDLTVKEDREKIINHGIALAKQTAYARIIYMWGDKVILFNQEYEFYYAAAILAAQMSALPVGFSLTEYAFPLASNITKTNDVFDDDTELSDLRAAGWWVLVKDDEAEPVKTSLQYTTDVSSLKMAESTTIQCLDTVAKRYRNTLQPILGRYNVNDPGTIKTVVAPSTEAVRTTLLRDKVVLSLTISKIEPATLPGEEDTMLVTGDATVGQPMNRMRFTFYI